MKFSTLWAFDQSIGADWRSPVAEQIAGSWRHDDDSVRFFRTSANAIYILNVDGKRAFLRFNADSERSRQTIENELAIIDHVRQAGLRVVQPLPSRSGNLVESMETTDGLVHAVLFDGIAGRQHDPDSIAPSQIDARGATVARLHNALQSAPTSLNQKPPTWVRAIERGKQASLPIRREAERLENLFAAMPQTSESYGLLHGDLELDNMLWNRRVPTLLDFDEYASGWTGTDIAKALDEVEPVHHARFLEGYRRHRPIGEDAFTRDHVALVKLQGWASLDRAIDLTPDDVDRDWMKSLIVRLSGWQREYEASLM